jgi:hypothetical protein
MRRINPTSRTTRLRAARPRRAAAVAIGVSAGAALALAAGPALAAGGGFIGPLHHIRVLASTVPGNGDVNPYGVAVVSRSVGRLERGDVLVSNFNSSANTQGTGTTIVEISPSGHRTLFARIPKNRVPGGVGLTTALVVLRSGWVFVGDLPTKDGTAATAKPGAILVIDPQGKLAEIWTGHGIDGPWDATAADFGNRADLFVTNVLDGTVAANGSIVSRGTVVRLAVGFANGEPVLMSSRVIGSGFPQRTDPAALVIGPTGVALGSDGTLYVADTLRSRIAAIPHAINRTTSAGDGATVFQGSPLKGPLGLITVPGGDLVAVNSQNGKAVEVSPLGKLVAVDVLDTSGAPPGAGALFGFAVKPGASAVYFVDDATNQLDLLH